MGYGSIQLLDKDSCLMGVVFLLSSVYMTRFSYAKYSAQCHNGVVITANIGVKLQYFSTIHAHLCNICVSNQQSYASVLSLMGLY